MNIPKEQLGQYPHEQHPFAAMVILLLTFTPATEAQAAQIANQIDLNPATAVAALDQDEYLSSVTAQRTPSVTPTPSRTPTASPTPTVKTTPTPESTQVSSAATEVSQDHIAEFMQTVATETLLDTVVYSETVDAFAKAGIDLLEEIQKRTFLQVSAWQSAELMSAAQYDQDADTVGTDAKQDGHMSAPEISTDAQTVTIYAADRTKVLFQVTLPDGKTFELVNESPHEFANEKHHLTR